MQSYEMNNFSAETPLQRRSTDRVSGSARSSFDQSYFQQHSCQVVIRDDVDVETAESGGENGDDPGPSVSRHTMPASAGTNVLPEALGRRNPSKTRWINVVGWNDTLMDKLALSYLGDHSCLELDGISQQMLGGPVRCGNASEFIWIQTTIWFLGNRNPFWSSIQQCGFRMVICLPTAEQAGTLITNFVGKESLAREISALCTDAALDNHSMGSQALGCVWILAFAVLRAIAEQVDFAFQTFDPIGLDSASIPRMDNLPFMLERANNLARIDRYIAGLEEFSSFFTAVRTFKQRDEPPLLPRLDTAAAKRYNSARMHERGTLESSLAEQKIERAQKLGKTYMRQYESLVQMTISYSTSQITARLDSGQTLAERFASVGLILAGVSGLTSPFALVVGYYGMNVQEMVSGGTPSLWDFWRIGLPVLLLCVVGLGALLLRLLTRRARP